MRGLIRNHFYAIKEGLKWLCAILFIMGALAATVFYESYLLLLFSLLVMVAPTVYFLSLLCREKSAKWFLYKLTLPVTRKDIVKSCFFFQLFLLLAGTLTAGLFVLLSVLFRGYAFDMTKDGILVFALGLFINFMLGALFYPLYYLERDEKSELILGISVVCSIAVCCLIIHLINAVLYPAFGLNPDNFVCFLSATLLLVLIGILVFLLAFPVSVWVFEKREF